MAITSAFTKLDKYMEQIHIVGGTEQKEIAELDRLKAVVALQKVQIGVCKTMVSSGERQSAELRDQVRFLQGEVHRLLDNESDPYYSDWLEKENALFEKAKEQVRARRAKLPWWQRWFC